VVAEGLVAFFWQDLRNALESGFRRTPAVSPEGGLWLARWAVICVLVGLTLLLFCGYQGGFFRLNALAAQLPTRFWQWLTVLGDERVAFALTLFFTRRYPRVFWSLIAAALLGVAFTHSLKPLISALRPPAVLEDGTFNLIGPGHRKGSFPSGHSVTVAIFCGVWVYYARARVSRLLLILLAVLAGLSRVAVGVHWPVDVAAGFAGGIAAAWLGVKLAGGAQLFGSDPSIHLAFVTLAAIMAISLLLWDGGYPGASDVQRLLAVASLSSAVFAYLISPALRWLDLRWRDRKR
jgi:membrane-associated phospholipid phosphatase